MNLIDYIFRSTVRMQMRILKKDVDDSRFSTTLVAGLWLGWLFISIILTLSIWNRNSFSDALVNSAFVHIFTLAICTLLIIVGYFFFIKYDKLIARRSKTKQMIIYLYRKPFQYMFYRIYRLFCKWGENNSEIPTAVIISICMIFNILSIHNRHNRSF